MDFGGEEMEMNCLFSSRYFHVCLSAHAVHVFACGLQLCLEIKDFQQESLATKSGAKRLLLRWSTRREKDLYLASEVQTRAKVEAAGLTQGVQDAMWN